MSKLNIKELVTGTRKMSTDQPASFVAGESVTVDEPQEVVEEEKEEESP